MSQTAKRQPVSDGLRYRILRRDGFVCIFCGHSARDVELQVDHLWPVSKGGGNEEWNLATCCRSCNSGKRAKGERGLCARYEFIKSHYENIADAPQEEKDRLSRINAKVLGSPLIWMDDKAICAALKSIELTCSYSISPEAFR